MSVMCFTPLPVRCQLKLYDTTERTLSDRLEQLEGRTSREGREVADVRRGVFHCHSVIIETVSEQLLKLNAG